MSYHVQTLHCVFGHSHPFTMPSLPKNPKIIIGSAPRADPTVLETTREGLSDQHLPPAGLQALLIYPRYLCTFFGSNLQLFGVEHASEGTILHWS